MLMNDPGKLGEKLKKKTQAKLAGTMIHLLVADLTFRVRFFICLYVSNKIIISVCYSLD